MGGWWWMVARVVSGWVGGRGQLLLLLPAGRAQPRHKQLVCCWPAGQLRPCSSLRRTPHVQLCSWQRPPLPSPLHLQVFVGWAVAVYVTYVIWVFVGDEWHERGRPQPDIRGRWQALWALL